MQQTYGLERIGLMNPKVVYRNMSPAWLTEQALLNGEGVLSDTGALVVRTGKYTGRAPDDKFIVDTPSIHDCIAWNNINRPISKEKFNALKSKILAYFQNRPIYLFDGFAGADEHGCRRGASSILKAAVTPNASTSIPKRNRISTMPSRPARSWKTSSSTKTCAIPTTSTAR